MWLQIRRPHVCSGGSSGRVVQSSAMSTPYVFLDQNHWIYLAKAFWGKPHKEAHWPLPVKLLNEVESDRLRLPVSTIHMIELLRAENPGRRRRLSEVFELFSRGWFVASWSRVLPIEIHRAVVETLGDGLDTPMPDVFGKGFLFGLGPRERAELLKRWTEVELQAFQTIAALPGAVLELLTFPNEVGRTRQKERISELDHQYAEAAEDLRSVRKPYPHYMHRRAQHARYTVDLQNHILAALHSVGRTPEDFVGLGVDGLSQFWASVPSLDVDCELTLYRDRQWHRSVQPNDVRDLGHLVLAIPYCDAVLVERFWGRAIKETGLGNKYNVEVYTDLEELTSSLR